MSTVVGPTRFTGTLPSWWQRTDPRKIVAASVMLLVLAGGVWSIIALEIDLASMATSFDNAGRFAQRMFPLEFPPLGHLAGLMAETFSIVALATLLSVALSIPAALLAAWNTTPAGWVRVTARVLIVIARALPDMVLAIIFFRMFGLGGLPGVLAMGIHSVGMMGKLYADSLEGLPMGPADAVGAAGAGWWQRVATGLAPNWLPHLLSVGLYRFDINLRGSIVLGYVGVAGIGLEIADSLRSLNYQRGMALAFIMLVICVVVEIVSAALRGMIHRQGLNTGSSWLTRPIGQASSNRTLPPWNLTRAGNAALWIGLLAIVVGSFIGSRMDLAGAWAGLLKLPATLGLFLPPDVTQLDVIAQAMIVTIQIALASTLLGALIAIPVGVLAARNVFPHRWLNGVFRVLIVCVRGVPELILAIIFVVISGLGAVAGTLALSVGTVGILSKLLADSLEETDAGPQDALRAGGATRLQVFFACTWKQVLPSLVSHVMYVLDSHLRAATLLGVVGAGGIGFLLLNATRVVEFQFVTSVLLFILVSVLLVEVLSIAVRRSLR